VVKISKCRGGPLWPSRDDTAVIPYGTGFEKMAKDKNL